MLFSYILWRGQVSVFPWICWNSCCIFSRFQVLNLLSLLMLCMSRSSRRISVFLSSISTKTSTGMSVGLADESQRGHERGKYTVGLVFWNICKNPSWYAHVSSIQRRIVTSREGERRPKILTRGSARVWRWLVRDVIQVSMELRLCCSCVISYVGTSGTFTR